MRWCEIGFFEGESDRNLFLYKANGDVMDSEVRKRSLNKRACKLEWRCWPRPAGQILAGMAGSE